VYPGTFVEIAIFAVFIAPGIVYATVRVALVGIRGADLTAATRLLDALFIGVLFDAVYFLLFYGFIGDLLKDPLGTIATMPYWQAVVAVILLLFVPALLAFVLGARPRLSAPDPSTDAGREYKERLDARNAKRIARFARRHWYLKNSYRATPSAWDQAAFKASVDLFVRVRSEDGQWFGGWYGPGSFASTHPQPHDIFIARQWRLESDGTFYQPIKDSAGLWLPITDKSIVEWLTMPPQP
jgi:hypothetical protein